ncbi:MAG: hypothetical protein ISF22_11205 [Methanomassiliicoccus sp.]|nr:hypothetical protein [Methanomassiliicoccus sp.]
MEQQVKITPEMLASKNYPKIAFYLAAIGAMFMLFAGLIAIFFNSLYLAIVWSIWAGLTSLIIGIGLVICSVIIGGAATTLVVRPEAHVSAGATIIVVSLLALLLGFGWFWIVGAGFGVIGGILALVWRPRAVPA